MINRTLLPQVTPDQGNTTKQCSYCSEADHFTAQLELDNISSTLVNLKFKELEIFVPVKSPSSASRSQTFLSPRRVGVLTDRSNQFRKHRGGQQSVAKKQKDKVKVELTPKSTPSSARNTSRAARDANEQSMIGTNREPCSPAIWTPASIHSYREESKSHTDKTRGEPG
ncbi:hypothetical protein PoB_000973800 [Plakobranchus ocellatus]|uniref:Uncharacterized protein n=1 Tax=Plakobranchus ocellatus TaxID=259542 RepID=A0AAV3YLK3_9GAST|nr:hypothetical protein PoB_000973800 [Plakobranchus ocellatus]